MTDDFNAKSGGGERSPYPGYPYSGANAEEPDSGLNIRGWLLFLRRRKGIIISSMLIGTAVAAVHALNQQPQYTAETLLKIEDDNRIVDLGSTAAGFLTSDSAIRTEVNFLKSRALITDLVERLYRAELALARTDPATAIQPKKPGFFENTIAIAQSIIPDDVLVLTGAVAKEQEDDPDETALEEPTDDSSVVIEQLDATTLSASKSQPNSNTGNVEEVGKFDQAIEEAKAWLPDEWFVSNDLVELAEIPTPDEAVIMVRERRIGEILNGLQVNQVDRAYVISVKYTGANPNHAARISRELGKLYVEDQLNEKRNLTSKATDYLESRLIDLEQELRRAELAVQEYIDENENIDPTVAGVGGQQILQLTQLIVEARATRKEREARLRYIRDLQGRGESLESLSEVLQSPYIANLWQQETDLQRQKVELSSIYAVRHPIIQNIDAELSDIRERVNVEIARVIENLESELTVVRERESSVQADMDRLMSEGSSAGKSEVELRRLEREAAASRGIYENFLQRFKETREQQAIVEANARIIAEASPPKTPSSQNPNRTIAMGFALSSLLGVAFGFVREKLDNGVRSGKEIEAELGIAFLGLVPHLPTSKRRGKAVHQYLLNKPLSTYTETVRSLYTALRLSDIDNPPKVVQVTSAVPKEGKTTLSVSLAVALAMDGQKVCLVDGDFRHPSVRRELKYKDGECLVGYLSGDASLEQAIRHEMGGKLDVLPVLKNPPNPAPLIASQKMHELMETLRERFDYVVLDSPPILGMSDSKNLMELADTVLYVARWEQTTMDTAVDAIKELDNCHANVVGCVMTQVDITKHAQYGYGGIDGYYKKYRKYYVD